MVTAEQERVAGSETTVAGTRCKGLRASGGWRTESVAEGNDRGLRPTL